MLASVLSLLIVGSSVSTSLPPPRCGTVALRDLPPLAGATLGVADRPDTDDFLDSTQHPLRVHRVGGVSDDMLAEVRDAFDAAWALQVDGAGFPPPLADSSGFDDDGGDARLDVYLAPLPAGLGALTVSGGSDAVRPVFITLDPTQSRERLLAAAHHEFQHALQFAVDAHESAMWFESNAVYWELRGRPDLTTWTEFVPSFQAQPQAPIFTDAFAFADFSAVDDDTYEYGAALFVLYLDDVYGDGNGTLLRSLWQGSAPNRVVGEGEGEGEGEGDVDVNEPDWLDALAGAAAARGITVADFLADFATWRALTGDLDIDSADVADGPRVDLDGRASLKARALNLATLTGNVRSTSAFEGPFVGGCATFAGTAAVDDDVPLHFTVQSPDGHDLVVAHAVIDLAADRADRGHSAVGADLSVDVDVPGGATVVIAVCDVSAKDADSAPVFAPVELAFGRSDVVGEGEGDVGEGEGDVGEGEGDVDDCDPAVVDCGCACQASSAPSSHEEGNPQNIRRVVGGAGFFIGVFAFFMRAVRHVQRKRLYKKKS